MSGVGKRSRSMRSYLASDVLEAHGCEPIKEMLNLVQELNEIKKKALDAYESGRGMTEKGDAGPAYLGQAMAATAKKNDIYTALARFQYPTLAAVAMKDVDKDRDKVTERVVNAAEVRDTILKDPMAQVPMLSAGKGNNEKT